MNRSSNTFSAKTFTTGTNVFSTKSFAKSLIAMSKKEFERVKNHGWEGDNLTAGDFSEDLLSGSAFGNTEGIRHFEKLK